MREEKQMDVADDEDHRRPCFACGALPLAPCCWSGIPDPVAVHVRRMGRRPSKELLLQAMRERLSAYPMSPMTK